MKLIGKELSRDTLTLSVSPNTEKLKHQQNLYTYTFIVPLIRKKENTKHISTLELSNSSPRYLQWNALKQ